MSLEFRSIDNNPQQGICPICQDKMEDDLTAHDADKTQHIFHKTCLMPWLESHLSCPLCRGKVSSINGMPLTKPERGFDWLELVTAIIDGNDDSLSTSFGNETPVIALRRAILDGNLDQVRTLLTNQQLTTVERALVSYFAVCNDQFDIALAILETGPISVERLQSVIYAAISYECSLDVFRRLCANGPIQNWDDIFTNAADSGAENIVLELLDLDVPISESILLRGAMRMSDRGYFDIADALLTKKRIPNELLEEFFFDAVENYRFKDGLISPINRLKTLINSGFIPESAILQAIKTATFKCQFAKAKLLTKHLLLSFWYAPGAASLIAANA